MNGFASGFKDPVCVLKDDDSIFLVAMCTCTYTCMCGSHFYLYAYTVKSEGLIHAV